MIINYISQVIGRHSICFQNDLIIQFICLKTYLSPNKVLNNYLFICRY